MTREHVVQVDGAKFHRLRNLIGQASSTAKQYNADACYSVLRKINGFEWYHPGSQGAYMNLHQFSPIDIEEMIENIDTIEKSLHYLYSIIDGSYLEKLNLLINSDMDLEVARKILCKAQSRGSRTQRAMHTLSPK